MMSDPYIWEENCSSRLEKDLEKHGTLYIAFDFDNTVFDYHQIGDDFQQIRKLLRDAKRLGHKLILFTSNEGERLLHMKAYCLLEGFEPDWINENPERGGERKPYFNILLDDRAGLPSSFRILRKLLNEQLTNQ